MIPSQCTMMRYRYGVRASDLRLVHACSTCFFISASSWREVSSSCSCADNAYEWWVNRLSTALWSYTYNDKPSSDFFIASIFFLESCSIAFPISFTRSFITSILLPRVCSCLGMGRGCYFHIQARASSASWLPLSRLHILRENFFGVLILFGFLDAPHCQSSHSRGRVFINFSLQIKTDVGVEVRYAIAEFFDVGWITSSISPSSKGATSFQVSNSKNLTKEKDWIYFWTKIADALFTFQSPGPFEFAGSTIHRPRHSRVGKGLIKPIFTTIWSA